MSPARASGGQMIPIPAGDFWMGSDTPANSNRGPRHLVTLDAFEIDRFEVTNERYQAFMDAGGYTNATFWSADGLKWRARWKVKKPVRWGDAGWNGPLQPVVGVSWYEAEAFCRFENKRLPTEAEWEKAARGTDERLYPWGNDWDPALAQGPHAAVTADVGTHAGGASPYGVEDMAGNVKEWVADWYQLRYPGAPGSNNPTGPATGAQKVLRGGSWASVDVAWLQVVDRDMINVDPTFPLRLDAFGFRCARSVP